MFSHVMIGANDVEASRQFYDATLGVIGAPQAQMLPSGRYFWRHNGGTLAITQPINGEPASHGNGSTIGFACPDPETVDAWHKTGLEAGGTTCEDPPGWREGQLGKIYLAYLRDPSGNKLCALHRPA